MGIARATTVDPNGRSRIVVRVLGWLDSIGETEAFPEARAALAQAAGIQDQARAQAADPRSVLADVAAQALDGQISYLDAADELAQAQTRDTRGLDRIARQALETAYHRAWFALSGPDIVTEYIRPHIEGLASQAAPEAPKIPRHVRDELAALDAGPEVASAWSSLLAMARQIEAAWDLHLGWVIPSGLVEKLLINDLNPLELKYRQPWRQQTTSRQYGLRPGPVVRLLHDLEHGTEPTALTVQEAIALRESRDGVRTVFDGVQFYAVDGEGRAVVPA